MVNKEIIVAAPPEQVKSAVEMIATRHQKDMSLANPNDEQLMRLLCRTGYTWGIIASIQVSANDEGTTSITITCTHNKEVFLTHQLQAEYEEKYAAKLQNLLPEYLETANATSKKETAPKQNLKIRFGFLLNIMTLFIINHL